MKYTKIKRVLVLVLFGIMSLAGFNTFAQQKPHDGKSHSKMRCEMRDYKLKFLIEEMELKGETAKDFSKIYTDHFEAIGKIFKERHKAKKAIEQKANPDDADYAEFQKVQTATNAKEQTENATYTDKLNKLLTPKQLYKLDEAEKRFRDKMHELKAKRCQDGRCGPGKGNRKEIKGKAK